jgi:hypothetical protein
LSREEIGRHRWSIIMPMWNMPKEGFRQLYEKLPGHKPPFEEVWRLTGGNPGMLSRLYVAGWSRDAVVAQLIREKGLTPDFIASGGVGLRGLLMILRRCGALMYPRS